MFELAKQQTTITISDARYYLDSRTFVRNLKRSLNAEDQKLLWTIPNDISPYFGSFYWNTYSEEQVEVLKAIVPVLRNAVQAFIDAKNSHYQALADDTCNPIVALKMDRGESTNNQLSNVVADNPQPNDTLTVLPGHETAPEIARAEKVLAVLDVYQAAINPKQSTAIPETTSTCCGDGCCTGCCAPTTGYDNNFWFWYVYWSFTFNSNQGNDGCATCWSSCDFTFKGMATGLQHLSHYLSQCVVGGVDRIGDLAGNCVGNLFETASHSANVATHVALNGANVLSNAASNGAGVVSSAASNGAGVVSSAASNSASLLSNAASNGVGALGNVATNGANVMSSVVSNGAEVVSNVASSGADAVGHFASGGFSAIGNVAAGGLNGIGNLASGGFELIGSLASGCASGCDGCGDCMGACCSGSGDQPPPAFAIPFLALFGLAAIKPPTDSTPSPTFSPTCAPSLSNSSYVFSDTTPHQAVYDFTKNSPVANDLIWIYLFPACLIMFSFLAAQALRAVDNLRHNRAPRHTLQNILLVLIVATLAGVAAHYAGYEMKTSIAWEITAVTFANQLFTWWTLNNAYQKSFTLTSAQFNACMEYARKNCGGAPAAAQFPQKLAEACDKNYTTFTAPLKSTAENKWVRTLSNYFRPMTVLKIESEEQNNLQSNDFNKRKQAVSQMYSSGTNTIPSAPSLSSLDKKV